MFSLKVGIKVKKHTRVVHYCMNITVHSTCSLQWCKISHKLHKAHFLTGSQFGTKCIMIFIQYLRIFEPAPVFFLSFYLQIFLKKKNLNQKHDTRIHNSKEHAVKNTPGLYVARF